MKFFDFLFKQNNTTEKKTHWTDNWDKSQYRIKKNTFGDNAKYIAEKKSYSDDTFRKLRNFSIFDYDTYDDALNAINQDKAFFEKHWNKHNKSNIEYFYIK